MNLSESFEAWELNATRAPEWVKSSLRSLCLLILEPIRLRAGRPVVPTSGWRETAHNAAVGGVPTSQHPRGEACDFRVPGVDLWELFLWIAFESGLPFGQVIYEAPPDKEPWIHVSLGAPWRAAERCGQVLRYDGEAYRHVRRPA